jgi:glycosyltransferase involved in cell wall biosynthesis
MDNKQVISKLSEAIEELKNSKSESYNIGIGITTHNRYDIFKKTYDGISKFLPEGAKLVVVDDCSDTKVPEATYRFNTNVGIARSKNKCIELLYNSGCEHFFLMDDDCYPIREDWYKSYIESGQNHMNYIFTEFANSPQFMLKDTCKIYDDGKIIAYSHTRGCMCYYRRICFDKAGGMSPIFGKWGYEHPDLSNRIYNLGLTKFKYMDVVDSNKLIYSVDEHTRNANSTVMGEERQKQIQINSIIYDSRKSSTEYVDFRERENLIITNYFTKLNDFQRTTKMVEDISLLKTLIESLNGQKLIILNDCFDDKIDGCVQYLKVSTGMTRVYIQRWVSILGYLIENKDHIDKVFCVDGTDVTMLNNPFSLMKDDKLYCGDETNKLSCEWMVNHNKNTKIVKLINEKKDEVLLNAGLLGGKVETVISFISKLLCSYSDMVSEKYFNSREDSGDSDMGLFNYIAYTYFEDIIIHGTRVNTVFKDEKANSVSWFKHK